MHPANSMQGFLSVSLRVPSTDPLPLEPTEKPPRGSSMDQHPQMKSHPYETLEGPGEGPGREEKERGGMTVGLNPDNRMNLRDAVSASVKEDVVLKEHKYVNTSLPGTKALDTTGDGGNKPIKDEFGYYTVERDQTLEGKYNEVTLSDRTAPLSKKSTEHGYAVLEENNMDDGYSSTQPHRLVPDSKTQTSKPNPNERGIVVEEGRSMSRGDSVKNSKTVKKDQAEKKNVTEAGYDAPWVSHYPLPRRVTHSSTLPSKTVPISAEQGDLFDDPAYSGTFENVNLGESGGKSSTIAVPHPRTHSLTHSKAPTSRAHGKQKTEDVGTGGDVSEMEPPPPPPTAAAAASNTKEAKLSSHPGPAIKASKRDVYEPTSLALFDDPAYDVGMNMKR